ncbi:hypothetical protein ACET3Z_007734 [Daucus carota]
MSDSARVTSGKVDDSAAVELSGIIIIVTIMLLFSLVLLVIIFRLYSVRHHFWNRHTSREATSPDLPTLQQRQGLDPSILRSIKAVQISAAEDKLGLECSVCLCQVSEGEKARFLPKCNHGFHMQCIDIWFHSHSTCPLCRNTVSNSSGDLEAAPHSVDAGGLANSEPPIVSSSAPSSSRVRNDGHLAIDITNLRNEGEDQKSPVAVTPTAALYRSLSRLLSRNTRTSSP